MEEINQLRTIKRHIFNHDKKRFVSKRIISYDL